MRSSLWSRFATYCERHELRPSTEQQYRRILRLFDQWNGHRPATARRVNAWLRELECRGRSAYYRRSCRATLHAIFGLNHLRTVRCPRLQPQAWAQDELRRLLATCDVAGRHAAYFRRLILVGYHTGLSPCDLFALRRSQIDGSGVVRTRRAKTGAEVVAWLPPDVVAELPPEEHVLRPPYSLEMVRRVWRRIVASAGLSGPLKQLRRTSGTTAESVHPGHGHEHLADTRQTFERHYLQRPQREPIKLPRIA